MGLITYDRKESRTHNNTYKKLAIQWLNEALSFVSSFVVADSLVLQNRQLLVAANRCVKFIPTFKLKNILYYNIYLCNISK